MDSKSINRIWMLKKLKFFRFGFHLCIIGSVFSFFFLSAIASFIFLAVSALLFALSDLTRIDLDYPSPPSP